ncbi:MAG: hypothetical protein ACI9EF_002329 [Pseudohongiellaceae bacterium]|jgi:hypothetical protein
MNTGATTGQLAMIREVIAHDMFALGAMALMFIACLLA